MQCYVHNSQILEFSKSEIKSTKEYYLTNEDIKRYEDSYNHTPITKRKNPLSNPGFSIAQHAKKYGPSIPEGSHKILFMYSFDSNEYIEILEFILSKKLFGYEMESVLFHPFKDIKKHFPKCD